MRIVNGPAPVVSPRPARVTLPPLPKVTRSDVRRAPWTPNKAKTIIIDGCGHITIEWPVLRVLGTFVDAVYCEECNEWREIWREATPAERAGIVIPPPTLDDNPPF